MDYLDYESTLPDMKRTFFSEFKFYTSDKIQDLIKNIPETPYGQAPEGVEQRDTDTQSPLLVEVPDSLHQRLQG